MPVAVVGTEG